MFSAIFGTTLTIVLIVVLFAVVIVWLTKEYFIGKEINENRGKTEKQDRETEEEYATSKIMRNIWPFLVVVIILLVFIVISIIL